MSEIFFAVDKLVTALSSNMNEGVMSMLTRSGTVAAIDLIIIFIFSLLSWAIIFFKMKSIRTAKQNSKKFYNIYYKNKNEKLSKICAAVKSAGESHIANVFNAGYYELVEHHRIKNNSTVAAAGPSGLNINVLERALSRALSDEVVRFEKGLFFLATTGSTCPFLGLFGTIWGVMNAFGAIGRFGAPNLANIAPGISDALITTAAGLIAAIPAAVSYNVFNNSLKVLIADMENFSLEFLSLIERKLL